MGKKKKTSPEDKVKEMTTDLRKEFLHWIKLVCEGGTDILYADGCGISLVRNHIIYYRKEIRALCEASGMPEPKELKWCVPPEFPYNYMAKHDCERDMKVIDKFEREGKTLTFRENLEYEIPLDLAENHMRAWNHRNYHFIKLFNTYKGEGVIFW